MHYRFFLIMSLSFVVNYYALSGEVTHNMAINFSNEYDFKRFLAYLAKSRAIKSVNVSTSKLGDKKLMRLLKVLDSSHELSELNLIDCNLTNKSAQALLMFAKNHEACLSIKLKKNHIDKFTLDTLWTVNNMDKRNAPWHGFPEMVYICDTIKDLLPKEVLEIILFYFLYHLKFTDTWLNQIDSQYVSVELARYLRFRPKFLRRRQEHIQDAIDRIFLFPVLKSSSCFTTPKSKKIKKMPQWASQVR